ncbi:uncharacterized protein [Amphiura filiformis]|uniref:uncharacterized protein n=1 Tax=Amphiura filiformis TaxID=82378 RepID=UPI003B21A766
MDRSNIFSMKLATISNLFALQTDGEEDNDACKQFSAQFIQDLEELHASSGMSGTDYTDCYKEAVQYLIQVCANVPFICQEFSAACHRLLEYCFSVVISRDWMQVDTACQQSLAGSLLTAHQYLVPWAGHGFFLAAGLAVEPWSHPSLHKILLGQSISQEEVHAYVAYEGHYLCQERIKILLEENYVTHALNLSLYCAHDSEMRKNSIYLETLVMLQDDLQKADEMWNEIQWHQCTQQVIPIIHSLLNYAVSTAATVSSMLILKEWQMETTSLKDMRHITLLWVMANWQDCRCIVASFEQRVEDLVKATDDSLYRMYLADAIFCTVEDETIVKLCVQLCLSAFCKPPNNPETSYLATSTVDLNNSALCHVIAKMIKGDCRLYRLCLLTAFCITPSQESLEVLEEAYNTTPNEDAEANPSKLPAVVHCGTVMCLSELLPRMFTPKHTLATNWTEMKRLCERLLRCTKFVPSKWTLSNGETVVVKTYVKHDLNQSDTSEGDRTAEDTEESDVCEVMSESDNTFYEVSKRKRGRPAKTVSETTGSDMDYVPSDANELANDNSTQYNLRPGRQRIDISGTDEETDVSSWNGEDDSWSESMERDTSEDASSRERMKGHLINKLLKIRLSPGGKRTVANHNGDGCQPKKRKARRPRKDESQKRLKVVKGRPQRLVVIESEQSNTANSEELNEEMKTAFCVTTTATASPTSAISTAAVNVTAASITTVAKVVKPIQTVLKSMTNSDLTTSNSMPTTASNEHAVCEGHKPANEDPYLLLKSRESNRACTSVTKSVNRNDSIVSSLGSRVTSTPSVKEKVKYPPYPVHNKSELSPVKAQDVQKTVSDAKMPGKKNVKYPPYSVNNTSELSSVKVQDVQKALSDDKMAVKENVKYPPYSVNNKSELSSFNVRDIPKTVSNAKMVVKENVKCPPYSVNNKSEPFSVKVRDIPQTVSDAKMTVKENIKYPPYAVNIKSKHSSVKDVPKTVSDAKMADAELLLSFSEAIPKSPPPASSNNHPLSPPMSFCTSTATSGSVMLPATAMSVCPHTNTAPTSSILPAPQVNKPSPSIPSSRMSYAATSTSNTQTCSNINILKTSGPGILKVHEKTISTPSSSPSHVQRLSPGSPRTPAMQNVQLIWTPTDNDTVTVEYNGKTFKVPVTNVPEGLSRNLQMASQCYSSGRVPTSHASSLTTSHSSASPGRVISIQTPILATPNLNRQPVSGQNPSIPNPNRQVVSVQTPGVANPNRSTTLPYASNDPNQSVRTVYKVVPQSAASCVSTSGIQIVPNVCNTVAITTPTRVLSGSGNAVLGSNPVPRPSVPYSSSQIRANSNRTKFVSTTPCSRVGYFQGVTNRFDSGGPVTSNSTGQGVQAVTGSPQRATQHIRIVYSPTRPMTRSQVAPTRPVTRAYARDSPRFAPYNAAQRPARCQATVKQSNVKGLSGQVMSKPYRTRLPDANGQLTKQMTMRNPNMATTTTPAPRKNDPNNRCRKLEILPCSPPSQKICPKPIAAPMQTKVSPTPTLPPQPQRIIMPSQQQLQQHHQAHQQHLHQQQVQQQQVQQQQVQQQQVQQQQVQQHQQLQQNQAILLVPAGSQTSGLGSNQVLPVQPTNNLPQASSTSLLSNHVNIQPLSLSSASSGSLITSFPASVPLFLTSTTGFASQLVISSTPASVANAAFPSPFKPIKTYAGKVRKSRLDSR